MGISIYKQEGYAIGPV